METKFENILVPRGNNQVSRSLLYPIKRDLVCPIYKYKSPHIVHKNLRGGKSSNYIHSLIS